MSTATRSEEEALEPKRLRRVRRRQADAQRPDARDAAAEVARTADLRVRPALVDRVRDRGGARRPRRRVGGVPRISSSRSRSRSRSCSRSWSSRTGRRCASTRRAAVRTSSRARTSARRPSLVAAAALLTDYVLTVAVSISAGIFAITSFAPFAHLAPGRPVARLPAGDRAREPARRAGVGDALRAADLRVHRVDPRRSTSSGSSSA